ncbi:MAG: DUF2442 domain-containing protein [Spirochaetaceae bacterium]|nr:DUF2442 domain-containing protein [Spirochaetaceae bacterium]
MNFSVENARAKKIWFDENNFWIFLVDGRQLSIPKAYFPKLEKASTKELNDYELSGNGLGIHWDSLDEDLYVPNLLIQSNIKTDKKLA